MKSRFNLILILTKLRALKCEFTIFPKIQIVSALFPGIFIMHKSIIILSYPPICVISYTADHFTKNISP